MSLEFLLPLLALIASVGVVAVLLAGLTTMVKPNLVKPQTKTKIMQWRIYLQAAAVAFLVIAVALAAR